MTNVSVMPAMFVVSNSDNDKPREAAESKLGPLTGDFMTISAKIGKHVSFVSWIVGKY